MDYIIADQTIIPDDARSFYTEKIIYLPSYQANDSKSRIHEIKITRSELGIPENVFVYCCFNSNYKIIPAIFDSWMRILKSCENSVLLISVDTADAEFNLKREATSRGVDCSRLIFGKRLERALYLARYEVADLFLDTWPYNAGATASDALWMGLPIVTLAGHSFASRIGASLLSAIELHELITNTVDEYESLAIELAVNKMKLQGFRNKLIEKRFNTPLFDTHSFIVSLEAAYLNAIERYESGLQPDHIYIVGPAKFNSQKAPWTA
jgi:predicted O-linked N-acetylglucosamine transferase (SPINDLY family)